jgi:ribosomal protein L37E
VKPTFRQGEPCPKCGSDNTYEAEKVRPYPLRPRYAVHTICRYCGHSEPHLEEEKPRPPSCPECGSEREPRAEIKVLGENDETTVWVCPDCGHEEG